MKHLLGACFLMVLANGASALPDYYYGEISGSDIYQGNLDINFGWVNPPFALNSWGQDVNLWGIQASAGDKLAFDISSNDVLTGFSLYSGEVDSLDLLFSLFNNSDSFGGVTYLTGVDIWDANQSLPEFTFDTAGFYTLIVGGKDFGGYGDYSYQMDVTHTVPEPATIVLFGSGLLGLVAARRRRQARA